MVTVLVADARLRKAVHEFRPAGQNAISFTPAADWQDALSQAERPRAPLAAWVYLLLVFAAFILIYTQQRSAALLQPGSLPAGPPAISLMSLGALARPHIAQPRVLFF